MPRRPVSFLLLVLAACNPEKVPLDSGEGGDSDTDTDVIADTTPPTISLTSPADGATLDGTVTFAATATDDVGVEGVTFYVDGAAVGEATAEPWTFDWDATSTPNGAYTVAAVAHDAAGNEATTTANVTFAHDRGLDPSSVRFVYPTDSATLCGAITVQVAATSEVAQVVFVLDGAEVQTDAESPFTWDWDTTTAANARHTLRATAVAEDGRAAQETIAVTVENSAAPCDNRPSVRFLAPGADGYGRDVVEVSAAASDDVGVLNVQFFVDNGLVVEDSSTPHGLSWNTDDFDEGPHVLKAIAHDTADQTAEAELTFTVDRTSPTVSFVAPSAGEVLDGTLTIEADAADNLSLASVTLSVDGVEVEARTSAPYTWELDTTTLALGAHTLTVEAADRAGNTASDRLDVTVDNPPILSFVSPTDGAIVSGLVDIELSVTDDEAVSSVDLYLDDVLFDRATSGPYTFAWDTCALPPATHTFRAEARDARGNASLAVLDIDKDQALSVLLADVENDPSTGATAYVSDDHEVSSVVFDLDGVVLETVTTEPGVGPDLGAGCPTHVYSSSTWAELGVSSGTYVLGVTVTNAAGDTVTDNVILTLEADADGDGDDGLTWGGDDCDDDAADVHPGADEVPTGGCDGVDNDCDGRVDEDLDADGDGVYGLASCPGDDDCDDTDPATYPGAPEVCGDGVDQDCSTLALCGALGEFGLADADAKIIGEDAGDDFGAAVWIGDVNDDGWADLLVAGPDDDDGGTDAGAAYVFFGPTLGDRDASGADVKLVGEDTEDSVDGFATVDVDGDGALDLILGAHGEETGGRAAGAAYVFTDPVTRDADMSTYDAKIYGEDASDWLGWTIAADDLDGDGRADLLMGAPQEDEGGTDAGAAYVAYGPLSGSSDVATADAKLIGERAGDAAGWSVAVGDVDGDGLSDLVVGAYMEGVTTLYAGATYLVLGAPSGDVDLSTADAKLTGESGSDTSGTAVAAGDLDGDGLADIVVSAPDSSRAEVRGGTVYVVAGTPRGTVSLAAADAILTGEAMNDHVGESLSTFDYDGDGLLDLAVGAIGIDGDAAADAGGAYVVFGPLRGTMSLSAADVRAEGDVASADAGRSVHGGDLDDDGFGDLVIGSEDDSDGGAEAGAVYLVLGGAGE